MLSKHSTYFFYNNNALSIILFEKIAFPLVLFYFPLLFTDNSSQGIYVSFTMFVQYIRRFVNNFRCKLCLCTTLSLSLSLYIYIYI